MLEPQWTLRPTSSRAAETEAEMTRQCAVMAEDVSVGDIKLGGNIVQFQGHSDEMEHHRTWQQPHPLRHRLVEQQANGGLIGCGYTMWTERK